MAALTGSVDVKIADVVDDLHVTVNLKGLRMFWPRYVVGCLLIRLGAWIVGFGRVNIE